MNNEHRGQDPNAEALEMRREQNKNKLDLKPNVDFVTRHAKIFEQGYKTILERTPDQEALEWADKIEFTGTDDIVEPQVYPEDVKKILARMPKALIQLSKLKSVSYHTFGHPRVIPVPGFDEEGNFDRKKVNLVPVDEFPRKDDHPSRILVGVSDGKKIYPTPIPETVSKDKRAVFLYQIHVLIHEFFHTVDYPRRTPGAREEILLETDGQQFTLQNWWEEFEELILSGKEPICVSSYANTYKDDLNTETAKKDYNDKFTSAIAEQMSESFVAHQLGIVSNDEGWTEFKKESFGNEEQRTKFTDSQTPSANLKWQLIDKLCRAKVITK